LNLPCIERIEEWEDGDSIEHLKKELVACESEDRNEFSANLGKRLVLWAAECGHLRIVELLIQIGVDVDVTNQYGETPLHLSVKRSEFLVVRQLLESNASVTVPDDSSTTPLHCAAEVGDKKVMESLIRAGAVLNVRDECESTPLDKAVLHDNHDAIEQLLAALFKPNNEEAERNTLLIMAGSGTAPWLTGRADRRTTAQPDRFQALKSPTMPNEILQEYTKAHAITEPEEGKSLLECFSMVNAKDVKDAYELWNVMYSKNVGRRS